MKQIFTAVLLLILSSSSFGLVGEWQTSKIPHRIKDVKIKIFNYGATARGRAACGSTECFRMNVFLNDKEVATWVTSPGELNRRIDPPGSNTPEYKGRSIHRKHVYDRSYTSWVHEFEMPYAMYIKNRRGKLSNYAIHGGPTDGTKRSHGCIRLRLRNAKQLNYWVRQAFRNGGKVRVWADGTN